MIDDERANLEVARVIHHKTCALCRGPMVMRESWIDDEQIFVCCSCGYWAGIGFREWRMHHHLHPTRSVIGRYSPLRSLNSQQSEFLVTHLRRTPSDMPSLSPRRAEKFVADLLAEALDCEVHPVGKPGDGGVDAYVVSSDEVKSIVQVKWRQNMDKTEGVAVVREVGGTLLARGVPDGIIVSNRKYFSPAAQREAEEVGARDVAGIGTLRLQLVDYHTILDLLDLASRKVTESTRPDDWFPAARHEDYCIFEGASRISHESVRQWGSVPE